MAENLNVHILLVMLIISATVAMTVKWIKLPYSIALVIVGLACGGFHLIPALRMTPELVMLVFLPALLFEASFNLDWKLLRENWLSITVLATIGVLITMGIVAFCMFQWAGFPWQAAALLGAMVSATDPISVLALFRKLGIDLRLTTILEGESLFNDGTAVVLFGLVLNMVRASAALDMNSSLLNAAGMFVLSVIGGAAVGAAIGYLAARITRLFDDHLLEITLTTIVAYGSFLMAEEAHVSPVISVVTAGIVIGNYARGAIDEEAAGMTADNRVAVDSFWEYAAFVVNSLVFLLIGLQVEFDLLVKYAMPIGIGIASILISRIVVVYGLTPFIGRKNEPITMKWRHLLFWGALRGSLSMALALSLPPDMQFREPIVITTFGVVLFTLLIPGLTIEPLVSILKMKTPQAAEAQPE